MRENGPPNIPIKPSKVLYLGIAGGMLLTYMANLTVCPKDFKTVLSVLSLLGYFLLMLSMVVMSMACFSFSKVKTNIRTDRPAESVVTDGIFRFTRNPIYLSFCLLGVSLSMILNSLWVFLGTVPFCVYIHHLVIPEEERYMGKNFGDVYMSYKRKTPRWL